MFRPRWRWTGHLAPALAAVLLAGCTGRPDLILVACNTLSVVSPSTEHAHVRRFVAEAVGRLPARQGPIVASLNCTHYGYVRRLWEEAFASLGYPGVKVLDPNPLMTDLVLGEGGRKRYPRAEVSVEVVSKVPISPETRANLGTFLVSVSPLTADALARYRHEPELFAATVEPSAVAR